MSYRSLLPLLALCALLPSCSNLVGLPCKVGVTCTTTTCRPYVNLLGQDIIINPSK